MPRLTGPDLKLIREGLLLSAQALTDRFKAAGLVPVGHVRTIQRWEEGARPVPDDIAAYVLALDGVVGNAAKRAWEAVVDQEHAAKLAGKPLATVAMIRYDDPEHCPVLEHLGPGPHHHRLHSAMLHRLRVNLWGSRSPELHLVAFQPEAFNLWRRQQHLNDTPEARAQWASIWVLGALSGEPAGLDPITLSETEGTTRTPHPRK